MADLNPFSRQEILAGWGPGGQDRLGAATVLIVGLGGLGGPAAAALARAGVGRLLLVDPDRVEGSNLARQTLFTPEDTGRLKVEAGAEDLGRQAPWTEVVALPWRAGPSNLRRLVEAADLVIDGTDTFASKFLVHDACLAGAKALVQGSALRWEALVHLFAFDRPGPGCWRCLHPEPPADGVEGPCAAEGVAGSVTGLAAQAMATAALRHLLGLASLPPLTTWAFSAADWAPRLLTWQPRAGCRCHAPRPGWGAFEAAAPVEEAPWDEVPPAGRRVVVDLREPHEIAPGDRAWFEARGARYLNARWALWATKAPAWEAEGGYLLVCAHGVRSRAALATVPPGVRALSLAGGTAALGLGRG